MKQQIVVIHGGDAFEDYKDYLANLRTKEITLEKIRSQGWKGNLGRDLGNNYEVITPKMPNAQNARYLEWKIWFEKILTLSTSNNFLHNLGVQKTVYDYEKQIDQLIYKIYGLTPEEIEIVEDKK